VARERQDEEIIVKFSTADLCDAHPELQVAEPLFADFGALDAFAGPVATLKVYEDNAMVRSALEEPGAGRVLVIDGGGSLRCALVGGNLAQLGASNDWRGIILYGCIRDSAEVSGTAIGVKALGLNPRRSEKGIHGGVRGRRIEFAGVTFDEGDWVYADADGVVTSKTPVHSS
jgi:regulator of ribonuclease activity A